MGVIDIVEKPSSGGVALDIIDRASEIISKVRTAARVRVVRTLRGGFQDAPPPKASEPVTAIPSPGPQTLPSFNFPEGVPQVIAIGASTGGPHALQELLRGMPFEYFPPILVVQHLPEKFTREFAMQLDAISSLEINEAEHGQQIKRGQVYLAPGGFHLQIDSHGCLVVSEDPPVNHCRPSVDVLFHSLARHYGPHVLAFVLTGMGEDGAKGSVAIKRAGGTVLVQDEASCVVFGMPGAAIKAGGVDGVLSVDNLKKVLIRVGEKASGPTVPRSTTPSIARP
jgi:two-component system chemotaxis response regulator CheB